MQALGSLCWRVLQQAKKAKAERAERNEAPGQVEQLSKPIEPGDEFKHSLNLHGVQAIHLGRLDLEK